MDDLTTRFDTALASADPWTALAELATEAPPGLADALAAHYEHAEDHGRRHITWLLARLGADGDRVLLDLLARFRTDDLLRTAVGRGLAIPAPVLDALVAEYGETAEIVDAYGLSADPARVARLAHLLRHDQAELCGRAGLALARLGAREWAVPVAERVSEVDSRAQRWLMVALELFAEPDTAPILLRWLAEGAGPPAYDVHRVLVRTTGRDPLIPLWRKEKEYPAAVRAAWAHDAADPQPSIVDAAGSGTRVDFALDHGRGRIRFDFDPPHPGSSWPRWDRALHVAGRPLYRVSSGCGTCETTMGLLGFPPAEAERAADRVRGALAGVRALDPAVIGGLAPIVAELETGHYRAHLLDLPLEAVTEPERSWWLRRTAVRDDPERWTPEPYDWPNTAHFQAPGLLPGPVPTYSSILPSQPPERLDAATVDAYAEAIARGERPAALVLGWAEDRYVEADFDERHLLGVVLDGHHRLTAYARSGTPARILLLARLEDNRGEKGDWAKALGEALGAYAVG